MNAIIDHVVVAVSDLEAATRRYTALFGRRPSWAGVHPTFGTRNTLFRLENTYVELIAVDPDSASSFADRLRAELEDRPEQPLMVAIGVESLDRCVAELRARSAGVSDIFPGEGVDTASAARRTWRNAVVAPESARGLNILLIQHESPPESLPVATPTAEPASVCQGVDHLVFFTADAPAACRWWIDTFGAQPQAEAEFPARGTVNALASLSGITIECIQPKAAQRPLTRDRFWGIAYRVDDIERAVERVEKAGIAVDVPRKGLASGTRVATVRWAGVPTLLLARSR